jgi:hypothetical protein
VPDGELLYLSRRDVASLGLGFPEITRALESAFREKAAGRVVMPAKHWIERSPDTFYSAMTSYMPARRAAGCKWQSGDPRNTERGLAYILGLYILNDDETGLPIAIMDSTWLTAMRTAAASALTARYLSPERPARSPTSCRRRSRPAGCIRARSASRSTMIPTGPRMPSGRWTIWWPTEKDRGREARVRDVRVPRATAPSRSVAEGNSMSLTLIP